VNWGPMAIGGVFAAAMAGMIWRDALFALVIGGICSVVVGDLWPWKMDGGAEEPRKP